MARSTTAGDRDVRRSTSSHHHRPSVMKSTWSSRRRMNSSIPTLIATLGAYHLLCVQDAVAGSWNGVQAVAAATSDFSIHSCDLRGAPVLALLTTTTTTSSSTTTHLVVASAGTTAATRQQTPPFSVPSGRQQQVVHLRECNCFDDLETVYCPLTSDQCVRPSSSGGGILGRIGTFFRHRRSSSSSSASSKHDEEDQYHRQRMNQQYPSCIANPPSSVIAKIVFFLSILCLALVTGSIFWNEYFGWSLRQFFVSQFFPGYNEAVVDRILRDHPQRARQFFIQSYHYFNSPPSTDRHQHHHHHHEVSSPGMGIMALCVETDNDGWSRRSNDIPTEDDDNVTDVDDEDVPPDLRRRNYPPRDRGTRMPWWWWFWRWTHQGSTSSSSPSSLLSLPFLTPTAKNINDGRPNSLLLRTKTYHRAPTFARADVVDGYSDATALTGSGTMTTATDYLSTQSSTSSDDMMSSSVVEGLNSNMSLIHLTTITQNRQDGDDWTVCAICLGTVYRGDRIGALPCHHVYRK